MKYLILFLYNFYKYTVMLVFALLSIILIMYDISMSNILFWIVMFSMSLVQFFAYCNGIKAQLEKQFIETYNEQIIQNIIEHENNLKNN